MKLGLGVSALALTLLAACSAMPGNKEADEHAAHHPPVASTATQAHAGYDQQMAMIQEMHRKMAEARTPDERAALMKDHMKTMQDGMAMMGQMRSGTMGGGMRTGGGNAPMSMDPAMMKRRMDMMESMMQMIMDRDGMKPAAAAK